MQFSFDKENLQKNLFSKPYPNTEIKSISSEEKNQQAKLLIPKKLNSCIYCRKIPETEDKKNKNFFFKQKKYLIDSISEIRLPFDYIDISYDQKKAE